MVFWESVKETVQAANSKLSTTKYKWIGRYLKLTSLFYNQDTMWWWWGTEDNPGTSEAGQRV